MIWFTSKVVMTLCLLLYREYKKRSMDAEDEL